MYVEYHRCEEKGEGGVGCGQAGKRAAWGGFVHTLSAFNRKFFFFTLRPFARMLQLHIGFDNGGFLHFELTPDYLILDCWHWMGGE